MFKWRIPCQASVKEQIGACQKAVKNPRMAGDCFQSKSYLILEQLKVSDQGCLSEGNQCPRLSSAGAGITPPTVGTNRDSQATD
jgi:hypothetical protein